MSMISPSREIPCRKDLELGLAEGWRDLVLDDLDAGRVADDFSPFLSAPMRRMSSRTDE